MHHHPEPIMLSPAQTPDDILAGASVHEIQSTSSGDSVPLPGTDVIVTLASGEHVEAVLIRSSAALSWQSKTGRELTGVVAWVAWPWGDA